MKQRMLFGLLAGMVPFLYGEVMAAKKHQPKEQL